MEKLSKVVKSGGRSFNVTVLLSGQTLAAAQEDAMKYYVWKLQRVLREASAADLGKWEKDGITVHYSEVGKKVESPEETVGKMSDEQARAAFELLKAKLGM